MFRWGGGGVFKRRGAPWGGIGFGGGWVSKEVVRWGGEWHPCSPTMGNPGYISIYIYIFEQLKKGVSSKETSFPN